MRKHKIYKIAYKALKRRYKRSFLRAYNLGILQCKNANVIKKMSYKQLLWNHQTSK